MPYIMCTNGSVDLNPKGETEYRNYLTFHGKRGEIYCGRDPLYAYEVRDGECTVRVHCASGQVYKMTRYISGHDVMVVTIYFDANHDVINAGADILKGSDLGESGIKGMKQAVQNAVLADAIFQGAASAKGIVLPPVSDDDDDDAIDVDAMAAEYAEDGRVPVMVFLDDCGYSKLEVIRVIRKYTGMDLPAAKEITDKAPTHFVARFDADSGSEMAYMLAALSTAGASGRCPTMNATFNKSGVYVNGECLVPAGAVSANPEPVRSSSSYSSASHSKVQKKGKGGFLVIAALIVIAVVVFFTVIQPAQKYDNALALIEEGNYAEAYALLQEMSDGYKDVSELKKEYQWYGASVGDTLLIGCYEQDNDTANGKEEIEWLVLAVENGRALVISKNVLDAMPYHTNGDSYLVETTWAESNMRAWLNGEFFDTAFTGEESSRIPLSKLTNPDRVDQWYTVEAGEDTEDKVFLLSFEEYEQYLDNQSGRKANATAYAAEKVRLWNKGSSVDWRLRSPGAGEDFTMYVSDMGYLQDGGFRNNFEEVGVRPAMWIQLASAEADS